MGNCAASYEATAVATSTSKSKVILPDGHLEEYIGAIRVAQVLRKQPSNIFLCNADDMEFDGYVSPVGPNEVLHSGQIYFALPRTMLKRRLVSEDMAALAIRASSALTKSGAIAVTVGGGCKTTPAEGMSGRRGTSYLPELTVIAE